MTAAGERFFYFQPQQLDEATLERVVELVPDKAAAKSALDAYRRTRGPTNLTKVDEECVTPKKASEDTTECRWWDLVLLVGTDIENAAAIFRKSETLEDNYSEADANALVRLGRYLVVLNARNFDEMLTRASEARSSALKN